MKKNFQLDNRNVGGLKVMSDNMYKHHKALIDAKPAIHIKPPKPVNCYMKQHVDQKKRVDNKPIDLPMYKNKKEFDTVIKTFQTVIGMKKGRIDSNAPISMEMRRQLTGNLTKKEKFEQGQHLLNLQSQYRRMQSASSMQERKKNQFDPIAHPPRFFRREGQSVANIKIDKLMQHFTKEHRVMEDSVDTQLTKQIEEKTQRKYEVKHSAAKPKPKRSQSAKPPIQKKQEIQHSPEEEVTTFVDEIPKVEGNQEKDYEILKDKLISIYIFELETIFKHKVYKTDDLESLFGRVLVHNPQLDLEITEMVFQLIRDEFQQ